MQNKKREGLKSVIRKGKAYLLGSKWTQEKVDEASGKTINKAYALYKQRDLNEKGEKTGKALGKHVINLYSTEFLGSLKSEMLKNYGEILRMI